MSLSKELVTVATANLHRTGAAGLPIEIGRAHV